VLFVVAGPAVSFVVAGLVVLAAQFVVVELVAPVVGPAVVPAALRPSRCDRGKLAVPAPVDWDSPGCTSAGAPDCYKGHLFDWPDCVASHVPPAKPEA